MARTAIERASYSKLSTLTAKSEIPDEQPVLPLSR
jgi:hypothetical protein